MIRTTRKILSALLFEFENKVKMTDDLLTTLFIEIENIINSRPLTTVTSDHGDQVVLTPNDILRLHSRNVFQWDLQILQADILVASGVKRNFSHMFFGVATIENTSRIYNKDKSGQNNNHE